MLHLTNAQEAIGTALSDGYSVAPGRHDEAMTADGGLRAHWRGLADWLTAVGGQGYGAAAEDLGRLRTESGLAFAARDTATGPVSDALPVILAPDDWAKLERGIEQRAALADAAITDVYTDRRTLAAGLVPPGLIYGGASFAAHCAAWERPPRHWAHVYEADVARTADGEWVILSDRLDTPLGDGWLLANRIATTQAYADLFVDLGVRRLATHYSAFQAHLDQMMGWEGRLVLLTAGEHDPRFFSHAYFARYLDAALVEPADLTVREGAAFVKTLGGLRRVDVMLRGVPDAEVDALHRPGRAAFGAPALSLAARSGSLKIVNAIGCAAFAYRALAPYAHRLAQHLLGEELLLSDAPCLWLGGDRAREQVLGKPEDWLIEPLTGIRPEHDQLLSGQTQSQSQGQGQSQSQGRDQSAEILARTGERYCATQMPELATTPTWTPEGIFPKPWIMRVFAGRTAEGWRVAPGGVASTLEPGQRPANLGFGKDVWVLPDDAAQGRKSQAAGLMTQQFSSGHLRRTGRDLLSRVADELFWLGRNAERAEAVLRILSVCLGRYLGANRTDADPEVLSFLAEAYAAPDEDLSGKARYRDAIERLTSKANEPSGVQRIIATLRSGGLRARASISAESWRYIERLCSDRRWQTVGPMRQNANMARLIEDSLQELAAFAGSAQENLTRNFAWRFLELGRRIERAMQIAHMAETLAEKVAASEETYLRAWLTLSDSESAYRSRYMMTAQPAAVIDLLVLDESNPRALAYQLVALERVLSEMPSEIPYRRAEHRRALALLTELRLMDADVLGRNDDEDGLKAFAERCQEDLAEISNLIGRAYFAHADAPEAMLVQARAFPDEGGAQ
ncbi:MAG: circularly permuted type 2 ATP-grasp protein [Pseudomonadota bacterium]